MYIHVQYMYMSVSTFLYLVHLHCIYIQYVYAHRTHTVLYWVTLNRSLSYSSTTDVSGVTVSRAGVHVSAAHTTPAGQRG